MASFDSSRVHGEVIASNIISVSVLERIAESLNAHARKEIARFSLYAYLVVLVKEVNSKEPKRSSNEIGTILDNNRERI